MRFVALVVAGVLMVLAGWVLLQFAWGMFGWLRATGGNVSLAVTAGVIGVALIGTVVFGLLRFLAGLEFRTSPHPPPEYWRCPECNEVAEDPAKCQHCGTVRPGG